MITDQGQLLGIMQKCLERRADGRYYPTPAGCIRLREILAEHGLDVDVRIGTDERFEIVARAADGDDDG